MKQLQFYLVPYHFIQVAKVWDGGLILKKSFFVTQLHLLDGSDKILDCLIDDDGENNIVIKQRLKMDQVITNFQLKC